MNIRSCSLFFLSLTTPLAAATQLTGQLSSYTLTAAGNPYFVEKDIHVPAGKTLEIGEGCVFLFRPFTGINVEGSLVVGGSGEKPVVFTSIHDADHNPASSQLPNPFDWNGILITKESDAVSFKNFILRYSVYGIKSQNPAVKIRNGMFAQNGQFHFTINYKIQYVQDNVPYSYNVGEDREVVKIGEGEVAKPAEEGAVSGDDGKPSSLAGQIIRYSCLGVSVASLATGIVFSIKADDHRKERDTYSPDKPLVGLSSAERSERWNAEEQARIDDNMRSFVFFALSGVCAAGFTLTFFF